MADRVIIHDTTPDHLLFPTNRGRGLDLSSRPPGYAYGAVAEPFPASLLIPRSEWQARIEEQEATRSRIPDLCDFLGIAVKNQEQTNYCWVNAPTHCVEIIRGIQNQAHVSLSAASVGAQITGYANRAGDRHGIRGVGGFGLTALRWIADNGIVPTALWPANAIDPRYATDTARQSALAYRPREWWELEPRNLDQVVSCLLRRFPVSAGYGWWSHQVTLVAALWIDGAIAIEFDNSWGTEFGTNGRGALQGDRMLPDDVTAPRTAIAA